MLEQPGCPNLYWALTNLPSPLIPLEKGMEGERMIVSWRSSATWTTHAPMDPDQIKKFIAHIDKMLARSRTASRTSGAAGVAGRADQGRGDGRAPPAAASSSDGLPGGAARRGSRPTR